MAVDSQFRMPGAFHSEGVHPGLYRPPPKRPGRSPSASGYLPNRLLAHDGTTPTRKRTRDSAHSRAPVTSTFDEGVPFTPPARVSDARVSTKHYILAGQVDNTPTGDGADALMGESVYSDADYRRQLGTSKRTRDDIDNNGPVTSIFPASASQQEGYYSQQAQLGIIPTRAPTSSGWGSFAVSALGGVVGRIWQFCTVGSFKGFHAGGGKGYEMRPSIEEVSMFQGDFPDNEHPLQHVPGYFPPPVDELVDQDAGDSRSSSPAARPAKRRQMTSTTDIKKDWVFVSSNGEATSTRSRNIHQAPAKASPKNRNSGPSMATGRRISTPTVRRSTGGRPSLASTPTLTVSSATAATASSASYASQRSPSPSKIPTYSASTSTSTSTPKQSVSRRHTNAAPAFSHRRTNSGASVASVASARGSMTSSRRTQSSFSSEQHHSQQQHVADSSPRLSAEAKKLAARRRREADAADERMSAMGDQLQQMIRQAKEALGTTFEVNADNDDGGWEDEGYA
jgi:hypothetical protein